MFNKGEIPFVRLLVPLIAGVLVGYFFSNEGIFKSIVSLGLISLLVLTVLIFTYRRFSIYRFKWFPGLTVHIFILAAGYWLSVYISGVYDTTHYSFQKAQLFQAEIISEPKISGQITRFEARIQAVYFQKESSAARGKIMISIQFDNIKTLTLKYGDLLLIPATYDSIDPPYNPGEFDYKSYLGDRQIYYQTFLSNDQFYLLGRGHGNPLILFALEFRKKLVEKFYHYLPDKSAAAFASTLILGYRAELSRELVEAYSKTGTMHVLSVSGMHVGIVFLVLTAVLRFMDRTKKTRLIRAFLIISVIWFYALLTGFSAPACRAAIMLSFIVLGKALNKHQNTYNLIAISAFFLLLFNPFYLVDTGFQLSYLAVTGIVYFHPKIYQAIYIKNKFLDYIWSYSALSLAAQLATFPFSIYYFHQFPVYFLISNLFVVFPVAFIMYAGILFMFIPFPAVLVYVGMILNWLINFTNNILYFIENLPFSSLDGIWVNSFECAVICLLILCISFRLTLVYKGLMIPIGVSIVILSLSYSLNWKKNYNQHQIVFYSLRKNIAIAYLSKGHSIIVSDIEESNQLSAFSLLPTVKSRGSRNELFLKDDAKFSNNSYAGDKNYFQFATYRILKWDKNFDEVEFAEDLKVSAVLISGNPKTSIAKIASCLNFTKIIIGADNPDYKIERWVRELKKMNVPYYILKKNRALIVNL
ncbi:MAG: ComEC family competence protein [Phormidesmis sp. FL-bin-119]|nr:ComEC family competence protein [Pedobacter sp.]